MMNKSRRKHIKSVVLDLCKNYGDIYLPMPIKRIAKSVNNCRLVSYSKLMHDNSLSYEDVLNLMETEDACTDYHIDRDQYVIYYNDIDKSRVNTYRYRWSIAHELGHILLGHHIGSNCKRLYRRQLSETEYTTMEYEANVFAAYLLVPHILLSVYKVNSSDKIASICKISSAAAHTRFVAYLQWCSDNIPNQFDSQMRRLFFKSPHNQHHIYCAICGARVGCANKVVCHVCGGTKIIYDPLRRISLYYGIKVDMHAKAVTCPCCNRSMLGIDLNVCPYCHSVIRNICMGDAIGKRGPCVMSEEHPLTGDARYCPYCGSQTTFAKYKVLHQWDELGALPC